MMFRAAVFIFLLSVAWAAKPFPRKVSQKYPVAASDEEDFMLPKLVVPTHYNLRLNTYIEKFNESDPESFMFDGVVAITVQVLDAPTNTIILHSSDNITISAVTCALEGAPAEEAKPVTNIQYNSTTNKLTLTADDGIVFDNNTNYVISITYTGLHGDDMHGFYRSSYINDLDEPRWLVTTQFESYDARRAFPCFDEPAYKATYDIWITVDKSLTDQGYNVLSNMPQARDPELNEAEGRNYYYFQTSAKKISSYLVAFIVSDFVGTESASFENDTKPFVTYGRERYVNNGEGVISQLAGPAALDVLAGLTKVNFGYPKVDQVGIPDFSAGAMENWGLVTYRERMIFYNETKNPISQKQGVVTVTTHELAHQWFGDLVTLHWWSDIWLNEGFATFFEYHASARINVENLDTSTWKLEYQMVVDELQAGAFAVDAQPNARPLTKEVYRPGDVDANFDDVAYSKGGSVLRMWMHALGEENFYDALNSYLIANAESNGTPELLLEAFSQHAGDSGLNPIEDFKEWHLNAGYPVLHFTTVGSETTISQERYLVNGNDTENTKWTVPITCTDNLKTDFVTTKPTYIFYNEQNITITHSDIPEWIVCNVQQTGYYRVNYNDTNWMALNKVLQENHTIIHELNRAQLLDDALWLARSTSKNYLSYNVALTLTRYLAKETELVPWKAALNNFNFLYGKVAGNEVTETRMRELILGLVKDQFVKLSLSISDSDSHTNRLLRIQLASWACKLGLEECVSEAKNQFSLLVNDSTVIHPDVFTTVVCTGVREGEAADWDKVWSLYAGAVDNAQQTQYLSALGCSKDEEVLKNYLAKTLDPNSGIRKQDLTAVFSSVYNGNPGNVQIALEFVKNNLSEIANYYGGLDPLGGLLTGIAAKLGTKDDVALMTEIKNEIDESTDSKVNAARVSAQAAVDIVTSNSQWLDQKLAAIDTFLQPAPNAAGTTSVTLLALLLPSIASLIFAH